ncbi:proline dehydrogenase 2, mitochondrial [Dorcoceras hygrometricum]|uniref:Proline dehydrogenase n=1 Tax=Dorcoceras hygrometricum TaxID=472368 RepID=A0A2Z7BTT7_9LAMI|nr:proline dehydrogenase 2, mitochondrial [Dorcoceras hygrometricum]
MTTRSVRPKLLHTLPSFFRRLNSAAPSSISAVAAFDTAAPDPKQDPITRTDSCDRAINVDDSDKIFSTVSTTKLIRSSMILHMVAVESMVDFGMWVLNSKLMGSPLAKRIVFGAIERSFYDHFCAGKDLMEVGGTVKELWDSGLGAMLDYGLEHATDNEDCDRNLEHFIRTAESVNMHPSSSVSFIVLKITAICPPSLLKRVSDLLRWEYKDNSLHLPWKLKTLPVFADSSPLYHTPRRPAPLTREEESDLNSAHERLTKLCIKCIEANVPLLIDAEDTSIQPAIDYLSYSAATEYRKNDGDPLIFNTVQAYLRDSKERLIVAKRSADEMGVSLGFKLVRGAYLSSERQLAASLEVRSPIHDTIQQTHACYNNCAAFMLEEICNGSGSVVLATHNVESGKLAASKAMDLGLDKDSHNLQFGQLYGMADTLSFGLRNAGFRVSKYLPFGPVEQIMPYLLRRAEENRGLLSTSSLDRLLMRYESSFDHLSLFESHWKSINGMILESH